MSQVRFQNCSESDHFPEGTGYPKHPEMCQYDPKQSPLIMFCKIMKLDMSQARFQNRSKSDHFPWGTGYPVQFRGPRTP